MQTNTLKLRCVGESIVVRADDAHVRVELRRMGPRCQSTVETLTFAVVLRSTEAARFAFMLFDAVNMVDPELVAYITASASALLPRPPAAADRAHARKAAGGRAQSQKHENDGPA